MCGKGFEEEEKFREHILIEHSTVCNNCEVCDKQFNPERLLSKHMATDHGSRSTDTCDDCGENADTDDDFWVKKNCWLNKVWSQKIKACKRKGPKN